MTLRRKALGFMAAAAVAVIAAAGGVWFYIGRAGATDIEQWIGSYLLGLVQQNIKPTLTWKSLDYQAPLTVVIDEPRLTDQKVDILHVKRLTLELTCVPRQGEPIQIARVMLDTPEIRLIVGSDGRFVGWGDLAQGEGGALAPPSQPAAAVATAPAAAPRFSDAIRLRSLKILNGIVVYQRAHSPAMTLPGITLDLNTPPDPENPGIYAINGRLGRNDLFDAQLAGRFNVDETVLDVDHLEVTAAVTAERYSTFPGELQQFLRAHRFRGNLKVAAQGRIPLLRPDAAEVSGTLDVREAGALWSERETQIDDLMLRARFARSVLNAEFDAKLLAGAGGGEINWDLDSGAVDGNVKLDELDAKQLLALLPPSWLEALPLTPERGRLSGHVSGRMNVGDLPHTACEAQLSMREARFRRGSGSFDADDFHSEISRASGALRAHAAAKMLGGRAEVDFRDESESAARPRSCEIRVEDVDVRQFTALVETLFGGPAPEPLGRLSAGQLSGEATLTWLADVQARGHVALKGGALALLDRTVTLEGVSGDFQLADATLDCDYALKLFGGRSEGTVSLKTNAGDLRATWSTRDLGMQEVHDALGSGRSEVAGRLASRGEIRMNVNNLPGSLAGAGSLALDRARLINLPLFTMLSDAIQRRLPSLRNIPGLREDRDTAQAAFEIAPDRLRFTDFDVESTLFAAQGRGDVYYDRRLALQVRAGPLQRAQSTLGVLGNVIRPITDQFGYYEVSGTLEEPRVEVRPLGLELPQLPRIPGLP